MIPQQERQQSTLGECFIVDLGVDQGLLDIDLDRADRGADHLAILVEGDDLDLTDRGVDLQGTVHVGHGGGITVIAARAMDLGVGHPLDAHGLT